MLQWFRPYTKGKKTKTKDSLIALRPSWTPKKGLLLVTMEWFLL